MDIAIIAVRNFRGELYVHQRADNKPVFPGLYGLGAGGKVESWESPMQAGVRELREELGLASKIQKLFDFDFRHPQASYGVYVFGTTCVEDIVPCKREFKRYGWMNRSEIDGLEACNKLCPDTAIAYRQLKELNWI